MITLSELLLVIQDEFREALVESETKFEQLRDAFESAVREASALKQLVAHSQHDRDQQEFTGQELRCLVAEQKNKLNELAEKCAQVTYVFHICWSCS